MERHFPDDLQCPICYRFDKPEDFVNCDNCEETICESCVYNCEICKKIICFTCILYCEICEKNVCESCVDNYDICINCIDYIMNKRKYFDKILFKELIEELYKPERIEKFLETNNNIEEYLN